MGENGCLAAAEGLTDVIRKLMFTFCLNCLLRDNQCNNRDYRKQTFRHISSSCQPWFHFWLGVACFKLYLCCSLSLSLQKSWLRYTAAAKAGAGGGKFACKKLATYIWSVSCQKNNELLLAFHIPMFLCNWLAFVHFAILSTFPNFTAPPPFLPFPNFIRADLFATEPPLTFPAFLRNSNRPAAAPAESSFSSSSF